MALTSNLRRSKPFWVAAQVTTALLLLVGARSEKSAEAAPAMRYQVTQRGDVVVFGNTLGYDCRTVIPKPTAGNVDTGACGANTDDNDIDLLWRSDEPAAGQATASTTITPDMARSTAVLKLPTGSFTSYARIYWSAVAPKGSVSPAAAVLIERPGVFSKMVPAETSGQIDVLAAGTHYQQSADITSLVQLYGPGAYRVSGVVSVSPVNQADQLLYASWSTVVFYTLKSDPPRALALFEGFDEITGASGISTTLSNFLVPTTGYDASPGAITSTGRNLDVAARGNAWLTVQALDGTEAYTRGGSLEVSSDGTLTTRGGLPVLGDGGPLQVPPDTAVSIGADGTVSAKGIDGRTTAIGKLKLVTPESPLQRGDDGLFRGVDGNLPADETARVQDGALEGSNVSAVESMVSMIAAARQFEAQMKAARDIMKKRRAVLKELAK